MVSSDRREKNETKINSKQREKKNNDTFVKPQYEGLKEQLLDVIDRKKNVGKGAAKRDTEDRAPQRDDETRKDDDNGCGCFEYYKNERSWRERPCDHRSTIIPISAALPPRVARSDVPPDRVSMPDGFHNHLVGLCVYLLNRAPSDSDRTHLATMLARHLDSMLTRRNKAIENIVGGMLEYDPNMVIEYYIH